MNAICVDDDDLILDLTISFMDESGFFDEVIGFTSAKEAIEYVEDNNVGVALLDVDMPEMDGVTLAAKLREKDPKISIVFLTGYAQYALDAFSVHADGYLLKPIEKEKLFKELKYIVENKEEETPYLIKAMTFGNFDVFKDGETIVFKRSKSKELLAYLIDQRGGTVTRPEAFAALWEDGFYDRSMQKQMDVIVRSLKETLAKYEISDILEIKSGSMRIKPELIDCDMYRYLDGDKDAISAFRGVYMNSYYWASLTEAELLDDF